MKTIISLTVVLFSFYLHSVAQDCSGGRYATELFPTNTLTSNILYGNNIDLSGNSEDLYLDVYEPAGDTESSRPLIIMAHGGSFIGGDKADGCTDKVCIALTKLGYVTASVNYRMGMGFPIDEQSATQAVYRATHDARAAVRFFRKDFTENGNTYGIDTSQIYFGGQSAGAFMAIHLAYMNDVSEMPAVIDTTLAGLGGGVEGNSGNPGYSSEVKAIISYSGAIVDTAFIGVDDTPMISFHGDADGTVPYATAVISVLGFPLMEVDGSSSIATRMDNLGIVNCFKPYPGEDHVTECIKTSYFDTSAAYVRNWMLQFACGLPDNCGYEPDSSVVFGVEENSTATGFINAHPNPTENVSYLDLSGLNKGAWVVRMYDYMGRLVRTYSEPVEQVLSISKNNLANGVYYIEITDGVTRSRSKVIFN
ncbi:MAG: carboxylesterase family protein [Flavobacteriales bacterium]|nr:carboxylesterase family protein [Flavobacteriales bacterium]